MKSPARTLLYSLGIPSVFVPGLILAATLGWNWQKDLARLQFQGGIYQNQEIFPKEGVVERAVDGDTIELSTGQTVRLIGVQAPERGHSLYEQSRKYLEDLVLNKNIKLEYETTDNMDKYGRLVAYVYVTPNSLNPPTSPNASLNVLMLKSGLAKFLFYPHYKKYKYFSQLQNAEREAQNKKVGLWSQNQ